MRRCFIALAIFGISSSTWLVPAECFAQSADAKARARALLLEGKELLRAARYDEGCPKLAESQKLDPSAEALVGLGHCLELQGKVATAWLRYGQVRRLPPAARRPDLERIAAEHVLALEPRIPRLQVNVPRESAPSEVRLN